MSCCQLICTESEVSCVCTFARQECCPSRSCCRKAHRSWHISIHSAGVRIATSYASCCSRLNSWWTICWMMWFTSECWHGMRAPPQELCCESFEQLRWTAEVPLPWTVAQLDVDVNGCDHSEGVCCVLPLRWTSSVLSPWLVVKNHTSVTMRVRTKRAPRYLFADRGTVGGAWSKSALRVNLTFETDRAGDCARTDIMVVEWILELQRVLVHPGSWRHPQVRVWNGYYLGVCIAVGLLAGEGGDVVIVIVWCLWWLSLRRVLHRAGVFTKELAPSAKGCTQASLFWVTGSPL